MVFYEGMIDLEGCGWGYRGIRECKFGLDLAEIDDFFKIFLPLRTFLAIGAKLFPQNGVF